jgi:hypothetical protein
VLTFRNILTYYLSIEIITLVKIKTEIKSYMKCLKMFLRKYENLLSTRPNTAQNGPKTAQRSPAQHALTRARGSDPRTRKAASRLGLKWPSSPYLSVAVGSDPTAVRPLRPGQKPGPPLAPANPRSISPSPSPVLPPASPSPSA